MMDSFDLVDVWREQHLQENKYTWFGPYNKRSRLDYFLISSDLQYNLVNTDMDFAYKSDHSPVNIEMKFIHQERGKST